MKSESAGASLVDAASSTIGSYPQARVWSAAASPADRSTTNRPCRVASRRGKRRADLEAVVEFAANASFGGWKRLPQKP